MLNNTAGYCYNSLIYEGAKYENGEKVVVKGLGKSVVFELMEQYLDKNHVVITDNFYTSVELGEDLLEKNTYLVGQIKGNAKGLDKSWIDKEKKELKSKKGRKIIVILILNIIYRTI